MSLLESIKQLLTSAVRYPRAVVETTRAEVAERHARVAVDNNSPAFVGQCPQCGSYGMKPVAENYDRCPNGHVVRVTSDPADSLAPSQQPAPVVVRATRGKFGTVDISEFTLNGQEISRRPATRRDFLRHF